MSYADYYIYAYIAENTKEVYYIGKGRGRRAYAKHRVPTPANKNLIIIMEKNLTNTGALALERRYIKWYGRIDTGTGILLNRTDGGDGISSEIAATWLHKAKESGKFYTGIEKTRIKRDTASRVIAGYKAHETRMLNNKPYQTESSIAKMVETRKANGSYTNSSESIDKMLNTRKEKGLDKKASELMKNKANRDYVLKIKNLKHDIDTYLKSECKIPKITHNCSASKKEAYISVGTSRINNTFGTDLQGCSYAELLNYRDILFGVSKLPKSWHVSSDSNLEAIYYKLCRLCLYLQTVNSTKEIPDSLIAAAQIGHGAASPTLSDFVTLAT